MSLNTSDSFDSCLFIDDKKTNSLSNRIPSRHHAAINTLQNSSNEDAKLTQVVKHKRHTHVQNDIQV
jgi:hypothetical protein